MANPTPTPQETLSLIEDKAKTNPERASFYVKIARKGVNGLVYQQVASFGDVTLAHLSDPARWLLQLGGGGEYVMRVAHVDTQTQEIGGPLYFSLDTKPPNGVPTQPIDASATFREGWAGPPTMLMPTPVQPTPGVLPPNIAAQVFGGTRFAPPPLVPQQPPPLVDPNTGAVQQPGTQGYAQAELERRRKELDDREAKLRSDIAEKEAKIREDRFMAQMEAQKRELDAKLAQIASATQQPKAEPSGAWVKDLAGVVLPMLTQMFQQQHEMRMLMVKQGEENSKAQLAAQERSHAQLMEFMKAAQTKPAGMNEELKLLVDVLMKDKASNSGEAMAAMSMRMVDAMNMVTKNSISMMEAMADQLSPAEEHPAVAAIREGVKAIGIMSAGMRDGARKVIPGQQPQMMPAQVPQRPQAAQPQAHARPAPQARPPQPAPHAQPVRPAVAPAPVQAAPPPAPAQPAPVEILEAGIRQQAPIEQVAAYFIGLVKSKEPSIFAALEAADGDPELMAKQRLGDEFVLAHTEYLSALVDEMDRLADEAGLIEGEPEPVAEPAAAPPSGATTEIAVVEAAQPSTPP